MHHLAPGCSSPLCPLPLPPPPFTLSLGWKRCEVRATAIPALSARKPRVAAFEGLGGLGTGGVGPFEVAGLESLRRLSATTGLLLETRSGCAPGVSSSLWFMVYWGYRLV